MQTPQDDELLVQDDDLVDEDLEEEDLVEEDLVEVDLVEEDLEEEDLVEEDLEEEDDLCFLLFINLRTIFLNNLATIFNLDKTSNITDTKIIQVITKLADNFTLVKLNKPAKKFLSKDNCIVYKI